MPTAPRYILTLPPSGIGPMAYALKDGFKSTGKFRRFGPDHQDEEEAPTADTPPPPAYKPKPIQRRTSQRRTTLNKLLFSIVPPPPLEAFFWFEDSAVKWKRKEREDVTGEFIPEWHLKLNGKKPDLGELRKNLISRLQRRYKEGYFLYRWLLEYGSYGLPVLHLHLMGDPGPGHTLEAVTEHLTKAWLELTEGAPDNLDLVRVQPTHENSRNNFSKQRDSRLAPDLERILGGRFEFGKVHKSNILLKDRIQLEVTAEQLKDVLRIVAQHHMEYEGLLDTAGTPAWDAWARSKFLQALSNTNFYNVFLNEVTGPKVMATLGLE